MLFIARTSLTHYCQDMPDRCKVEESRGEAVGMWESRHAISKAGGNGAKPGVGFARFPRAGISTAGWLVLLHLQHDAGTGAPAQV